MPVMHAQSVCGKSCFGKGPKYNEEDMLFRSGCVYERVVPPCIYVEIPLVYEEIMSNVLIGGFKFTPPKHPKRLPSNDKGNTSAFCITFTIKEMY